MAEAEENATEQQPANAASGATKAKNLVDTGDFDAAVMDVEHPDAAAGEGKDGQDGKPEAEGAAEAVKKIGPGAAIRGLRWLIRWHPLLFLGIALGLAAYAWVVYPEPESRKIPPAELFYYDGLDRLYRVINPDLPLLASTPADEALAARNAFLNLFVFHRETLADYPDFINPHLLLAEANRMLAENNPGLAEKYWTDAINAYADADLWERPDREPDPGKRARYIVANYLDGRDGGSVDDILSPDNDEARIRRERRADYIRYRRAEADVNLKRPEVARPSLEALGRVEDSRNRESFRLSAPGGLDEGGMPRHIFELGPDDYRDMNLLLARVYDGLGLLDPAHTWYLRYLGLARAGRNHSFVIGRLADIAMDDGEVYRRVDPELATAHFETAAEYYRELVNSPAVTHEQHDAAVLGLARANSRLSALIAVGEVAGVDELGALGRGLRRWLEEFSGQQLPRRTLGIPLAVGETLSRPELILPARTALPGLVAGSLGAMAGGNLVTPRERRRVHLTEAMENYDRIAEIDRGTHLGDRAAVMAAWAAWDLGLKEETEARFERMIDPLANPDLVLAARLGLATAALDRGELRRAHMLILGGYAHPLPLWFSPAEADWRKIAVALGSDANRAAPGVWRRLWDILPAEGREIAGYAASGRRLDDEYVSRFLRALNGVLRRRDFYVPDDFPPVNRNFYLTYILNRDPELLTEEDVVWRNRLLLEEAWPYEVNQSGAKDNIGFEPFPPGREIIPDGILEAERVRGLLTSLAAAWSGAADRSASREERFRMVTESNAAYQAALDDYGGDPGEILNNLAKNYERLAELRELQQRHMDALAYTTKAAFSYLDVSLKARGSPREMESLLASGDAFFRSGLLERTVESQRRFMERFGYNSLPGSEGALAVVRAENLLGRAYWFLNMTDEALGAFGRNISRRTPDRFKSMYYIGRILMDEGVARDRPELLGSDGKPLPALDRNGDPVLETALEAFNHIRQSPGINPTARAWRWSTFDLGRLRHIFAERARRAWEAERSAAAGQGGQAEEEGQEEGKPWLALYDTARQALTEALERYPLRRNGEDYGVSVRVEPEDYADVMASRFEAEYLLANTLLTLADERGDDALYSLARAHLENLRDPAHYAEALFNAALDRFQLNAAIIREEVEGGNWDKDAPLPRTRLGDDEGPTHSPLRQRDMLVNAMLLLANDYFRAGEKARLARLQAPGDGEAATGNGGEATGYYQDSYRIWQDIYDRFGLAYGPQAMVNMGDCLNRLGNAEDAANHYRMARNMSELAQPESGDGGVLLSAGPEFWGGIAGQRLQDMADGYLVP